MQIISNGKPRRAILSTHNWFVYQVKLHSPEKKVEKVDIQKAGDAEFQYYRFPKWHCGKCVTKKTKSCHVLWQ